MGKILKIFSIILSDLFLVSLFLYLAAVRADLSLGGLLSRAFNLNILLAILFLSGIGAVFCFHPAEETSAGQQPRRLWFYTVALSILIGVTVFEVLNPLSAWAPLMGVASGAIVFLTSFVMIREYGNK